MARALGWEAGVRRDRPQLALCFQTKRCQATEHPFCPTPCLSAHTQERPQPPSFFSPPVSLALTLPCPQLQGPLSRRYSLPPTQARDTLSQHPAPGYSSNFGSEHTAWLPCYFLIINLSLVLHKSPNPLLIHCTWHPSPSLSPEISELEHQLPRW